MTSPQWAKDPHSRAELRYWDGANWTSHVSSGGRQWDELAIAAQFGAPIMVPVNSADSVNGKLRAAGIMAIVQSSFILLIGLWIVSVAQSDIGQVVDSFSGGSLTFIGILFLAVGGGVLAAAIGSVRSRPWGRITLIVFESIFTLIMVAGLTQGDANGGGVLVLLYTGTVLGLAIAGR